jgi:hypothetical protein
MMGIVQRAAAPETLNAATTLEPLVIAAAMPESPADHASTAADQPTFDAWAMRSSITLRSGGDSCAWFRYSLRSA